MKKLLTACALAFAFASCRPSQDHPQSAAPAPLAAAPVGAPAKAPADQATAEAPSFPSLHLRDSIASEASEYLSDIADSLAQVDLPGKPDFSTMEARVNTLFNTAAVKVTATLSRTRGADEAYIFNTRIVAQDAAGQKTVFANGVKQ